jgi:cystathionine gamma-synthase
MKRQTVELRGVVPVVPTPFRVDESIDLEGLAACIEFAVRCGVCAVCLPAYASEFYKLTEAERRRVLETAIRVAAGRVAVLAQSNHPSARCAAELAQQHADLGADVVLHSTTKYLGGHSDVQGGGLVFRNKDEGYEATRHLRKVLGGVASPFNSWLVLRGLRSLGCRVDRHCANALALARALAEHPAVSSVHYPGLETHAGHEVARRQMRAFGGMLSFQVKGGRDAAINVVSRVRLFLPATSLGGTESLIEHRRSSEGPTSLTPDDLLRVSVGLEHPDDLVADLEQALG